MENGTVETKLPQRDISVVTAEIKNICAEARRMMLIYAVEIGRRLVEAKQILPHGEWGKWLENEVEFSQSTANKHMQLFEKFGSRQVSFFGAELNSETFTNLSYSQALKLLAIPDEEREAFVKDNDIENKSVREIDQLIKERDEAQKRADNLESEIGDLQSQLDAATDEAQKSSDEVNKLANEKLTLSNQISEIEDKLNKAKESEKKAKAKLKDLKTNPEIPQEKIDDLRASIEKELAESHAAEIEKRLVDIRKQLEAATDAEVKARREAENAANTIAELGKQIRMADPAVTQFRLLFNQIQDDIIEAKTALDNIKDDQMKDKLRGALKALAAELEA